MSIIICIYNTNQLIFHFAFPTLQCMKQNLEKYCVQNGIFGDITFELDDGHMKAHRAMLVARCDVMKAMLNGDFREAHANLVRVDGSRKMPPLPSPLWHHFNLNSLSILPTHTDRTSRCDRVHLPQAAVLSVHRRNTAHLGGQVSEPARAGQPAVFAPAAKFGRVSGDRGSAPHVAERNERSGRTLSSAAGTGEGSSAV